MTNQIKNYALISQKVAGKSQVEIQVSIPSSFWESFRTQALKNINEEITIDGFRKGMVPENILVAKIGEAKIIEEMAELAISKIYLEIITDNKIDAIGKPTIQVTKLAKDNPLEIKIVTAVVPEIILPDYKSIAKKTITSNPAPEIKVEEKEIEEAILKIRKSQASHEGHDHSKMSAEEHDKAIMENLPELNDEFVRRLGDFKDVPDFRSKIKEMIVENKKDETREKLRIKIVDSISDELKVEIPEIMIESELDRSQAQFQHDIERMGVKLEDYLKHAKKTIEDIRKEWQPHAEKKAKLQLVLDAIARAENIRPTKEEIDSEVNHLLSHYKDADRQSAENYAITVLTNEKIFQLLEKTV